MYVCDGNQHSKQRYFMICYNIVDPCNKGKHYMLEASSRLQGVEQLIDTEQYFLIHATRKSGKTTFLKDLTQRVINSEKFYALYCSLENMQKLMILKKVFHLSS